jgi:hypothetical protein
MIIWIAWIKPLLISSMITPRSSSADSLETSQLARSDLYTQSLGSVAHGQPLQTKLGRDLPQLEA